MLRIEEREAIELSPTSLSEEGLEEDDLREWVIQTPLKVLNEDLLIIGREVSVAELGDGIDVLAIDKKGNIVIIELKRGVLSSSVDFQSLKYTSYISRWDYEDIKEQFERFLRTEWGSNLYGEEMSFAEKIEEFCDDDYEIAAEERIYLVGSSIREKIGSVVLWLRDQDIDVSIVEFDLLKDEESELYLDSKTIVPTSDLEKFETGGSPSDEPWKQDGRRWHLEERTNEDTAAVVRNIVDRLSELETLEGPSWTQKIYIAFRVNGTNRILLRTRANSVELDIRGFEDEQEAIELAAAFVGDKEKVKFSPEFHGSTNRLRIKCQPEDELDLDELVSLVTTLI